jgi:hypothetical protein
MSTAQVAALQTDTLAALSTTQIYAKLDSRKLVEVALPWPGSAS